MSTPTAALAGRDHPAGVLRAEVERAATSHGGLVLVTGEAGIGKSTLAGAAAEEARARGALVLSGSCWDAEGAPGYWPWVQVVRSLRRAVDAAEWAGLTAAAGAGLAVLLGESEADQGAAFDLYDAVTTALVQASQRRPVVVVLDDLHWADPASLRLLDFAARHTWFERLLLIGTYRDVEVDAVGHPLRPLLAPLATKATTVTLTGLDAADVGTLMALTTGQRPAPELAAEVHRRTGGNPFFVEQTARLWRADGTVTGVAPGVADAVRRRLSQLPAPVVELLRAAAVLGREFHRQLLAASVGAPVPQVDRLLAAAVTARLVRADGGGTFTFAHDLVRETLYAELAGAAADQHAAVVRAAAGSPALAGRMFPAELARHAWLADGSLPAEQAVDLLAAAAHDASARRSTEEAIGLFQRAVDRAAALPPRRRARLLLGLGAQLRHAGQDDAAWVTFARAEALARDPDDAELLARVALGVPAHEVPADRARWVDALLTEAHQRLVPGGQPPLSWEHRREELAIRAAALARTAGDDDELALSLWAQHDAIWSLGTAHRRVALTDELIALTRESTPDPELTYLAAALRWVALLELGDRRYLAQHRAFVDSARRHAPPRMAHAADVDECIVAALCGRFDEAEATLAAALDGTADCDHGSMGYLIPHLRWSAAMLRGRYDLLPPILAAVEREGGPHTVLLRAITALESGAGAATQPDTAALPRMFEPLVLRWRVLAAEASGDPAGCEAVAADLLPYAGQWLVAIYGWDIGGPVDLWLGRLAAARGRWDDAVSRFTAAHRSADHVGAAPWSVWARLRLADALAAAGDERAATVRAAAGRDAAALGMPDAVPPVAGRRPDTARPAEFRRDGAVWTLGFGGATVRLPDAKGLRDLRVLLSRPGDDVPAVELLDPAGGALVMAAHRMGGDPLLDDEAKARYRRRLTELDTEIDRAAVRGDDARAAALDTERAALLDQLRAAAGLAGRTRRLGDEAERARKTVTARIRDVLRRLDDRHPALAAHLREAVSTGATCRYQPADAVTWRL